MRFIIFFLFIIKLSIILFLKKKKKLSKNLKQKL